MPNMTAQMHARRSVRTFDGRTLAPQHLQALTDLMAHIGNPYGLPTEPVMARLTEYCGAVLRTDRDGTVILDMKADD